MITATLVTALALYFLLTNCFSDLVIRKPVKRVGRAAWNGFDCAPKNFLFPEPTSISPPPKPTPRPFPVLEEPTLALLAAREEHLRLLADLKRSPPLSPGAAALYEHYILDRQNLKPPLNPGPANA